MVSGIGATPGWRGEADVDAAETPSFALETRPEISNYPM